MSLKAMLWALSCDLDPASKVLLVSYADFASDGGLNAMLYRSTLLERCTQVSESTINRRLDLLLREGYMREGNQDAVPDYVKAKPPESRPIVYDLAMDEETRLQWKAGYTPGPRRSAAAAHGVRGGRKSAERRRSDPAASGEGGVSMTPLQLDLAESQAAGGVRVQPPQGGVSECNPRGVTSDTPGGCTGDTPGVAPVIPHRDVPETSLNPGYRSSRHETATQSHDGRGDPEPGSPPPRASRRKRSKIERTPEQQEKFDQATQIARWWWDRWRNANVPIVGRTFPALRDSIVLRALEGGAKPQQVQDALLDCNAPFPSIVQFQNAIVRTVPGAPQPPQQRRPQGRDTPGNVWIDPAISAEDRDRMAAEYDDGVYDRGRKIQ